jgi:enoyl-CoA hydratase/carnithine racemase
MDIILTGYISQLYLTYSRRDVSAKESLEIGLANYMAPHGQTSLSKAISVAKLISSHPQHNLRNDRLSVLTSFDWSEMLKTELQYGINTLREPLPLVQRFKSKL